MQVGLAIALLVLLLGAPFYFLDRHKERKLDEEMKRIRKEIAEREQIGRSSPES